MAEPRRRILIVDDNVDLAEDLQEIFEVEGIEAVACDSGHEALRVLEGQAFSLVLTDMRMPGLSGLEVLDRVRASFPALPVVVMTAYSDPALLERARINGALAVVMKPVSFGALLRFVQLVTEPSARVLLLEDEPDLRVDLVDVLQAEGTLPYGCGSVREARRLMESISVDAAIIDISLPDGDGSEVVQQLWDQDSGSRPPVILITGLRDRVSSAEALALGGPAEVMLKPFDPRGLLARVRSVLRA